MRGIARLDVCFGSNGLGQMYARSRRSARIELPYCFPSGPSRSIETINQSNDVILHALEAADRNAKLNPGLAILYRHFEDSLRTTDLVRTYNRQCMLHCTCERCPAFVLAIE